ncbi:SpaA isopeptide-forming pilin-related protein [Weissella confusa]|uniref:SpaA isopeptide-forming pilin-related protein n=1 Tax=Weissella confusa TaxID=1583 RepID=UPI0035A33C2E
MAKWKNALLISTIVAPIAFGAGPIGNALADAVNDQGKTSTMLTDVTVHKYLNATDKGNDYYWGNGEVTGNPFDVSPNTEGWEKAKDGYVFTAYALPGDVISGFSLGDEPTISTTKILDALSGDQKARLSADVITALTNVTWADVLDTVNNAEDAPQKSNITTPLKDTVSSWSIVFDMNKSSLIDDVQAALAAAATKADGTLDSAKTQTQTTDEHGDATFDNLGSNEWIIFETDHPGTDTSLTSAVPMVLNLPMMKESGGWFGNSSATAVNLYPKDYAETGDLTVEKVDGETNKPVEDAEFIMFELPTGVTSDQVQAFVKDEARIKLNTADLIAALKAQFSGITTVQEATTGEDGKAKFSNVEANKTYIVMESDVTNAFSDDVEAGGYSEDATVHVVETQMTDPTDTNANDKTVYFVNGVLNVDNWDKPGIDKEINVQNPVDVNGAAPDFTVFDDNDFKVGLSRGEAFQYSVDTEVNGNLAAAGGYSQYSVTDTFDHQIDITDFTLGAWNGTTFTPLAKVTLQVWDTKANGGAGDWVSQDTDGGFSGSYDASKGYHPVIEAASGWDASWGDVDDFFTVSGEPSTYTMPAGGGAVVDPESGEFTITLTPNATTGDLSGNKLAEALVSGSLANDKSTEDSAMRVVMNAQLNSSATVGTINNDAQLTSKPVNGTPDKPEDSSKTFDAGWEFVKTDGDDQPLAGAGFDLSRVLTDADIKGDSTQYDRFLNQYSGIAHMLASGAQTDAVITSASDLDPAAIPVLAQMAEDLKAYGEANGTWQVTNNDQEAALATLLADSNPSQNDLAVAMYNVLQKQTDGLHSGQTVYFAHLDENGLPVDEMDKTTEMGDVLWTVYPALATTHVTDDKGYFQYCGLATGPYTLTETKTPEGYQTVDQIKFYLMNPAYDYITSLGSIGDDAIVADLESKYELKNSEAKQLLADYKADMAAYEGVKDEYKLLNGQVSDDAITGNADSAGHIGVGNVQIKNYEKSIFPLVGGIGTLFAVIAGLLAMGLALLKRKKDMKNEA